ncbi:hypothetical protein AAG906_002688 [Vitis piasezkii]
MVNRVVGDEDIIQNSECDSGLDPQKVADGDFDEDGRSKRTGTVWTVTAHIVTVVVGFGVLSLPWGLAQLGWLAGVATLLVFGIITFYASSLLAECYKSPVTGKRNYTYMQAVKTTLGGKMYMVCGLVQYAIVTGSIIGFTLTASISMEAILKSDCYHKSGHDASCQFSHRPYMIGMGIFEIFLSQVPNIDHVWWLSIMATLTSLGYSFIGVGLALATIISGHGKRTSVTGIEIGPGITPAQKIWRMFRALGNIALAYSYSLVLIEVQDTIKSSKSEIKVMKKANMAGVLITTTLYLSCACFGYAAFGNYAHGNMLTGFGFYEPFWLIDLANIFIVVHLVGAYQVLAQPVFSAVESQARRRWPKSKFVTEEYPVGIGNKTLNFSINFLRLTWRTVFVGLVTSVAMAFPFFNEVLALLGAISYWPLTVYFPVNMYIAQKKISPRTIRWFGLQLLNFVCLLVALASACGSVEGFGEALRIFKSPN